MHNFVYRSTHTIHPMAIENYNILNETLVYGGTHSRAKEKRSERTSNFVQKRLQRDRESKLKWKKNNTTKTNSHSDCEISSICEMI